VNNLQGHKSPIEECNFIFSIFNMHYKMAIRFQR